MNTPRLTPDWNALKKEIHNKWNELTSDEIAKTGGHYQALSELLQKELGYSETEAEERLDTLIYKVESQIQERKYAQEDRNKMLSSQNDEVREYIRNEYNRRLPL